MRRAGTRRNGVREAPGSSWPAVAHPLWLRWLTWRNETPERRPSDMGQGVWVGGIPSRRRWEALQEQGVTSAVGLTAELAPPPWLRTASRVLWLPVPDRRAPSDQQLQSAIDVTNEVVGRREGILFYCGAGLGRAPTLWAAWRLSNGGLLEDALASLKTARSVADPTPEQREALSRWDRARPWHEGTVR